MSTRIDQDLQNLMALDRHSQNRVRMLLRFFGHRAKHARLAAPPVFAL